MPVVSNASPLILYARIGRLDLLRALFGELHVPEAVFREVVEDGAGRPGADDVAAAEWIIREPAGDLGFSAGALAALGAGEAEAIALARRLDAPVLLDDRAGRLLASRLGLGVTGSAGVAVLAKEGGHVSAARPVLDELRAAGLRLHPAVYDRLVERTGESDRSPEDLK